MGPITSANGQQGGIILYCIHKILITPAFLYLYYNISIIEYFHYFVHYIAIVHIFSGSFECEYV